MEVLLFTDVARGYCCNNQASRERRKERKKGLLNLQKPSLSSILAVGEGGG